MKRLIPAVLAVALATGQASAQKDFHPYQLHFDDTNASEAISVAAVLGDVPGNDPFHMNRRTTTGEETDLGTQLERTPTLSDVFEFGLGTRTYRLDGPIAFQEFTGYASEHKSGEEPQSELRNTTTAYEPHTEGLEAYPVERIEGFGTTRIGAIERMLGVHSQSALRDESELIEQWREAYGTDGTSFEETSIYREKTSAGSLSLIELNNDVTVTPVTIDNTVIGYVAHTQNATMYVPPTNGPKNTIEVERK